MSIGTAYVKDLTFIDILIVIIFSWVLVNLWQRWIDNFTFGTLKLKKESTYHTFVIALVCTVVFIVFVFSFNSLLGGFIDSNFEDSLSTPSVPNVI